MIYTVRSGDTLSAIAGRHSTSVEAILSANPSIKDKNLIHPGQKITLGGGGSPAPGGSRPNSYTVVSGDTLGAIAKKFGTTVDAFMRANPAITNPNVISVGQVLAVPGAGHGPPRVVTPPDTGRGPTGLRAKIVENALLGYANAAAIHYSQGGRRMEFVRLDLRPPKFPTYTDCSAFATWCYWAAGAPDPNAAGYNGTGYTGTLIKHGTFVELANLTAGDLVFYGSPVNHVTVYIGNGEVISHGSEGGPYKLKTAYRSINQSRSYL